jgi:hypothetical protein
MRDPTRGFTRRDELVAARVVVHVIHGPRNPTTSRAVRRTMWLSQGHRAPRFAEPIWPQMVERAPVPGIIHLANRI